MGEKVSLSIMILDVSRFVAYHYNSVPIMFSINNGIILLVICSILVACFYYTHNIILIRHNRPGTKDVVKICTCYTLTLLPRDNGHLWGRVELPAGEWA